MTLGNFNPIRLTDLPISCALRLAKRAQCEAATTGTRSVFAGSAPPSGEDSNDKLPCRFWGERETQTVLGHQKGRWTAEVSAGCWNNGSVPRALILIRNQGRHGPSWSRAGGGASEVARRLNATHPCRSG